MCHRHINANNPIPVVTLLDCCLHLQAEEPRREGAGGGAVQDVTQGAHCTGAAGGRALGVLIRMRAHIRPYCMEWRWCSGVRGGWVCLDAEAMTGSRGSRGSCRRVSPGSDGHQLAGHTIIYRYMSANARRERKGLLCTNRYFLPVIVRARDYRSRCI